MAGALQAPHSLERGAIHTHAAVNACRALGPAAVLTRTAVQASTVSRAVGARVTLVAGIDAVLLDSTNPLSCPPEWAQRARRVKQMVLLVRDVVVSSDGTVLARLRGGLPSSRLVCPKVTVDTASRHLRGHVLAFLAVDTRKGALGV